MDLTAAYDTVWKNGLLLKLYKTLKCSQTVKLIEEMLSNRKFRVFLGEKSSKIQTLNNGLPRGAVLSPLLFNLYTQDIPNTNSRKFIYADDIAIATQDEHFQNLNTTLSEDVKILYDFFRNWRLTPNPSKTTTSCFHLNNRNKQTELNIFYNGTQLKRNHKPTYLGVTLDTSLTYNSHLEKLKQKLKTRNNLIHKLAGTNWGANASVLRVSALALVYSTAEYCAPVWIHSTHVNKIDTQLNSTMRIISGTLKSTPTSWLPVLSHIHPPKIRRKLP